MLFWFGWGLRDEGRNKMNKLTIAFDMDSTLCNIIDPWLADYNEEFRCR